MAVFFDAIEVAPGVWKYGYDVLCDEPRYAVHDFEGNESELVARIESRGSDYCCGEVVRL